MDGGVEEQRNQLDPMEHFHSARVQNQFGKQQ